MYLFQRIEEAVFKQNDARRVIGEFILENRDQLKSYTMEEIAKQTFTSKPTLVRFAKYFGYSGWKEFMYAFSHEVAYHDDNAYLDVDPNFPFSAQHDTLEIIESIATLKIQSIKDTVSLIVAEDLNKAAELLHRADSVVIYGTSPNYYYGELIKRNLLSIQKKAIMANSGESGVITQTLNDKDCAIMISYSGNSHDDNPTSNVKLLMKNSVPIISITSGGENYLRDYSDVILNISSKEKLYSKIANFATQESILFILDALFAKVFSLDYEVNKKNKISNSKLLESKRQATFKELSEKF
ncbi:MurR/RpiR family transcriptional regulator [Carnobacterium maltaromaticum]|uniref:MurR/RpiR family transcriptional regulator n=1 Tax=Lactobacillales TaxID=186826 RepID=UPI000704A50A|nr:MurR/RpiR family transcriptional regulator [Carnobacterium maltaromaticum]MBC9788774.1 SIS domain-containing protein [Carnobacterium maltaromaticum]MCC4313174.1 RpiR family transcriptional regulator [Carnobacterium maltaromaticum]MDT1945545.1 MurR/RpiR family transcriptional regulator [Carnobacterium maltaromaticum]MDT2000049.1 MurR/RpiR family transcriptional regulator [Carnobacterium maltaromaticum]TFJ29345.1 MurR/RpiR family transcriptional regulator [Carnobacterium maltaromaticum]